MARALIHVPATAKKGDYTPQFPLRLMHKDFELVLAAASHAALSMPTTEAAAGINAEQAASESEKDFSVVIQRMERRTRHSEVLPI